MNGLGPHWLLYCLIVYFGHTVPQGQKSFNRDNTKHGQKFITANTKVKSFSPTFEFEQKQVIDIDFKTISEAMNAAIVQDNEFEKGSLLNPFSKSRKVIHVEKTVIPFSQLAELKETLNRNRNLMRTIMKGVKFVEALNQKVTEDGQKSEGKDHMIEDEDQKNVSSLLEIDRVKDGLEFLSGSMKKLDSSTFFQQIQSEIFKFHSVPRFEKEIQAFQMMIHERIKSFISLNELVLVKPEESKSGASEKKTQMANSTPLSLMDKTEESSITTKFRNTSKSLSSIQELKAPKKFKSGPEIIEDLKVKENIVDNFLDNIFKFKRVISAPIKIPNATDTDQNESGQSVSEVLNGLNKTKIKEMVEEDIIQKESIIDTFLHSVLESSSESIESSRSQGLDNAEIDHISNPIEDTEIVAADVNHSSIPSSSTDSSQSTATVAPITAQARVVQSLLTTKFTDKNQVTSKSSSSELSSLISTRTKGMNETDETMLNNVHVTKSSSFPKSTHSSSAVPLKVSMSTSGDLVQSSGNIDLSEDSERQVESSSESSSTPHLISQTSLKHKNISIAEKDKETQARRNTANSSLENGTEIRGTELGSTWNSSLHQQHVMSQIMSTEKSEFQAPSSDNSGNNVTSEEKVSLESFTVSEATTFKNIKTNADNDELLKILKPDIQNKENISIAPVHKILTTTSVSSDNDSEYSSDSTLELESFSTTSTILETSMSATSTIAGTTEIPANHPQSCTSDTSVPFRDHSEDESIVTDSENVSDVPILVKNDTKVLLGLLQKQGAHSSVQILEQSVNLLKKLIMLSASNLGVQELPMFLANVLGRNSLSVTTPSTVTLPSRRRGLKNFKHNKFSNYYQSLHTKEISHKKIYEEDLRSDLLHSLRSQLTRSALEDEKLKAKANKVPIYYPRRRVNKTILSSIYRNKKTLVAEGIKEEEKTKLNSELQQTLKAQLARLEGDLASKKIEEEELKLSLKTELSESLRVQFSSLLLDLPSETTTENPKQIIEKPMTEEELMEALEEQLRIIF